MYPSIYECTFVAMKYNAKISGKLIVRIFLLAISFLAVSCDTGYRMDIRQLMSPGSLPYLKNSKLIQVSSFDTSGGNKDRILVRPGRKVNILDTEGPGMIVRMWFNIESRDPYFLRRIVIRIYWDNELKPSVEVPFGDFFGNGIKYTPYVSQYLGMTSGGYVCYFPMPFEGHARIEIANESPYEINGLFYHVEFQKFEGALESDVAYFHACWKRSIRTNYDSNYVLLNTEGRGHIVGMNMNMQSYSGNLAYLEGDEMIRVDGEKKPSIHGTGTEDFFSGGWYFNHGEFAGPYTGLLYKNDSLGQIAAYRLFIADPIPFKKKILISVEHGHRNQEIADYSSTVYWYQIDPHKPFAEFPPSGQRIPLRIVKPARMKEAEKLKFDLGGLQSTIEDMSGAGPEWGDNKQLTVFATKGSTFSLTMDQLDEPVYLMELYYSRGPDYGNADIYVNDIKAGTLTGYSPHLLPNGKVTLSGSGVKTEGKTIRIGFKVTGKDTASKGYRIGLDGFCLEPKRTYIPDWYILGPYPNPRKIGGKRRGLDTVYIPEKLVNLSMEYKGLNQQSIYWKKVMTPADGFVSIIDQIKPDEMVVAYAVTYIYSPVKRNVRFKVGSDDGLKVFFNGSEVHRYYGERIAEPDQAEVDLMLKPGWNELLLKIENNYGLFGFYARLIDLENTIVANADQLMPDNK